MNMKCQAIFLPFEQVLGVVAPHYFLGGLIGGALGLIGGIFGNKSNESAQASANSLNYRMNQENNAANQAMNDATNAANLEAVRQANEANIYLADKNNAANSALAEKNNAFNSAEAQKSRDYQTYMSNTSHQREVADLRSAGLNPILSGTGGAGASTPSGATAQGTVIPHRAASVKAGQSKATRFNASRVSPVMTDYSAMAQAARIGSDIANSSIVTRSQAQQSSALASKANAETENILQAVDANVNQSVADKNVASAKESTARIELYASQGSKIAAEISNLDTMKAEIIQRIETLKSQAKSADSQANLNNATISLRALESATEIQVAALRAVEVEMKKHGTTSINLPLGLGTINLGSNGSKFESASERARRYRHGYAGQYARP